MRYSNPRQLIFMFTALCSFAARSATYYVSPTGNNANNGTSQATAWQTIDRVNQINFNLQPGDKILFQRGGVYRGKLSINSNGTAGNYIEIGAYGTGAKPVIRGSVAVTAWEHHSGNI